MNIKKNKEIRKYPTNKPNQNNFVSFNRSPQPTNKLKIQSHSPIPFSNQTNLEYEDNIDENININEYLNNKQTNFYQNKNRTKGRSPLPNNNYYNYIKNYNYNTNYSPNIIKHFESDDMDEHNINYKNNKDDYEHKNKNLKKKIQQIKEQNREEYNQYINKNYGNNNIYNYNNYYNGNYYNNNYNENNNNYNTKSSNPQMPQKNLDFRAKKFNNYDNYRNYNKNKNKNRVINSNINPNKNYHKYSQDELGINNYYLSDNNFKKVNKNQTQENYFKKINSNNNNNNDSSSSNIYDDSYDYKTQYNFKKNQKNRYRQFAKFYSASSQENSYSDNKDDDNHNTSPFRLPLKNDEEHYHQNLTIKIKNPEEKKNIQIKYVDNTPEGCIVLDRNNIDNNIDKRKQNVKMNINNVEKINKDFLDNKRSNYLAKKNIEFPELNRYENKNEFFKNYNKRTNNNSSPGNYQEVKNKINKINEEIEKRKKIKEISVDLSPKKKLNLANSNQNLGRRINNNIQNNININPNKNSKIESCIITFDKNPKNPNKNKLSNSLDKIVPDNNKIRYIKKKVIISNNRKNLYNQKETPGFNNNQINKDGNEIKVYQKPGKETLSRSIGKSIENLEYSGEVKDYCAPSPDYGKKGKEAFLNAQKNRNKYLNNNSPYLSSSGKFQIFESNKKEKDNITPNKNKKYDEFSFKENNNGLNNINDVNYTNTQKFEVNIINNEDNEDVNNNYHKNTSSENFSIFTQQRMPTFTNLDLGTKNDNNNNKENSKENNKDKNDNNENKENILTKLVIKSFSNKKKEIREKPKLFYTFYKKYYDIYFKIPPKENIYMTKTFIKNKNLIQEKEKDKSYEEIEKKYFDKKLINAPIRGKILDASAKDFYIRNKLNSSFNDGHSLKNYEHNTIDIELEENNDTVHKNNNRIVIRTVIKKIKRKNNKKELLNNKFNKIKKNNINIELLKKENIKTKEQIKREKKVNSILKEDFENYIIFYKENITNNRNKKYDWSMVELLMIKIKLDIGDIIQAYLIACEDIINGDDLILIGNDYINNIIQHYKNYYLTDKNFEEIHFKILKMFVNLKDLNIELNFKYKALWGLINILINNELFNIYDFDVLKQCDEENKNEIEKILENCTEREKVKNIKF